MKETPCICWVLFGCRRQQHYCTVLSRHNAMAPLCLPSSLSSHSFTLHPCPWFHLPLSLIAVRRVCWEFLHSSSFIECPTLLCMQFHATVAPARVLQISRIAAVLPTCEWEKKYTVEKTMRLESTRERLVSGFNATYLLSCRKDVTTISTVKPRVYSNSKDVTTIFEGMRMFDVTCHLACPRMIMPIDRALRTSKSYHKGKIVSLLYFNMQ